MNERAMPIARMLERFAGEETDDALHIYDDGLILQVRGSPDRHLAVRDWMVNHYPGFEEARAGNWSVFLVPMDVGTTPPPKVPPFFVAATGGYADHRLDDCSTIESVVSLAQAATA